MTDQNLLRRFVADSDHEAFDRLVERHHRLVYFTALRELSAPHRAEDATQAVFILLYKKAESLKKRPEISGWLFQSTRLVCAEIRRTEAVRRKHESSAAHKRLSASKGKETEMCDNPTLSSLEQKEGLKHLNECLSCLNQKDRQAVVLHYLEELPMTDAAELCSCSREAFRKRLERALGRLRNMLAARGVALSVAGCAVLLGAESAKAAPAAILKLCGAVAIKNCLPGMSATVSAGAAASGINAVSASPALQAATGTLKTMFVAKVKSAACIAILSAASLSGAGAIYAEISANSDIQKETPPQAPVAKESPSTEKILLPKSEDITNLTVTGTVDGRPLRVLCQRPDRFFFESPELTILDDGRERTILLHKSKNVLRTDSWSKLAKMESEFYFRRCCSGTGLLEEDKKDGKNLEFSYEEIPDSSFAALRTKGYRESTFLHFGPEHAAEMRPILGGAKSLGEVSSFHVVNLTSSYADGLSTETWMEMPNRYLVTNRNETISDNGFRSFVVSHKKKQAYPASSLGIVRNLQCNLHSQQTFAVLHCELNYRQLLSYQPGALPVESKGLDFLHIPIDDYNSELVRSILWNGRPAMKLKTQSEFLAVIDHESRLPLFFLNLAADKIGFVAIEYNRPVPADCFSYWPPEEYEKIPGPHLSGKVIDENDKPVSGCEIRFADDFGGSVVTTKSDEEGGFSLRLPPDYTKFTWHRLLTASRADLPDKIAWTLLWTPGRLEQHNVFTDRIPVPEGEIVFDDRGNVLSAKNLVLRLQPACRISGQVTDAAGKPVPNACLVIHPRQSRLGIYTTGFPFLNPKFFVHSDENGYYSFDSVPFLPMDKAIPGTYRVHVRKSGYAERNLEIKQEEGRFEYSGDLTLFRNDILIAGTVKNNSGEPLEGYCVKARYVDDDALVTQARIDRQGRYQLAGVPTCSKILLSFETPEHIRNEVLPILQDDKYWQAGYPNRHRIFYYHKKIRTINTATGGKNFKVDFTVEKPDVTINVDLKNQEGKPVTNCVVCFHDMINSGGWAAQNTFTTLLDENSKAVIRNVPYTTEGRISVSPNPGGGEANFTQEERDQIMQMSGKNKSFRSGSVVFNMEKGKKVYDISILYFPGEMPQFAPPPVLDGTEVF